LYLRPRELICLVTRRCCTGSWSMGKWANGLVRMDKGGLDGGHGMGWEERNCAAFFSVSFPTSGNYSSLFCLWMLQESSLATNLACFRG
jgi:hypothetical protein